jgi:diketogulonate reductase-like aldo/keto reductase
LHAPGAANTRVDTWKALEDLQAEGVLRNIGVSNFGIAHLEKLKTTAKITPSVNQIELHPWLQRVELVKYCQEQGIIVEAYSPLTKASKLSHPVLVKIAMSHGMTPAQVLVSWSLSKGFVTCPKA